MEILILGGVVSSEGRLKTRFLLGRNFLFFRDLGGSHLKRVLNFGSKKVSTFFDFLKNFLLI